VGDGRILVLGYGNPGRLDDGLGPALVDAVKDMDIDGVDADADYQLQVEDSVRIAGCDVVVFADADVGCDDPFVFRPVTPRPGQTFTTHSLSPEALMALTEETFGARTEAYLLGIRGHEFDGFGEDLSPRARENLAAAVAFLEPVLRGRDFRAVAGR
jgi:hydrogenase maturation protease